MSTGPFAAWRWERLFEAREQFITGFLKTVLVSLLALSLALLIGAAAGILSTSVHKPLRALSRIFVEFFQNTPLAIQVFFMYNVFGRQMSFMAIGVIGIGIYHGAYVSEVFRAGITSIPYGQTEAAFSQGFTRFQAMIYVIFPQTIKIILPPLTNQAVNLIKNTSVMAIIAGGELMYYADSWASSGTLSYGPAYVVTGILYFLLCFPLATLARRYEETLKNKDKIVMPVEVLDV